MSDAMQEGYEVARAWWLFLITGVLWLILSLIVFRMELGRVYTISILFGVIAIVAGVNEFFALGWSEGAGNGSTAFSA